MKKKYGASFGRGGDISRAFNAVKWNYHDVLIAMQMPGRSGKDTSPKARYHMWSLFSFSRHHLLVWTHQLMKVSEVMT